MELIGGEIFIKIHFVFKFSVLILKNWTSQSLFLGLAKLTLLGVYIVQIFYFIALRTL